MVEAIITGVCTLVVGALAFAGVYLTNKKSNNDMIYQVKIIQAVSESKMDELTREVREHNNFAKRMPVVEIEICHLKDDVQELRKFIQNNI